MIGYYNSPIGLIKVSVNEEAITSVMFVEKDEQVLGKQKNRLVLDCINQLDEYFTGNRKTFDLPVKQNGTIFQQSVWKELTKIPFGQTVSYLDIARKLGKEGFVRAVGAANGQNNIAILVPCHRVIGSNGRLVGYAYGIERKKFLLDLEKPTQQIGLGI